MLSIYLGQTDEAIYYPPVYFDNQYEDEWIKEQLTIEMIKDVDRCKPDVHLHHCIADACGCDVSDEECQILLTDAVKMLNSKYPNMTVRDFDGVIWNKYRDMKK